MKKGLLFMLALTAAFLCPLTISAGDLGENLGFETKEISESQKQAILRSRKLSFSVQRSEKTGRITDYDISGKGEIAVCYSDGGQAIEVYDNDGGFLYEISFCVESGNYSILWHNENLLILSGLGNSVVEVSPEGEAVDVVMVNEPQGNEWSQFVAVSGNDAYHGYVYRLKTRQGFFSRKVTNEIVRQSLANGQETVVLQCLTEDDAPFFWWAGFPALCVLILGITFFVRKITGGNDGNSALIFHK